nr:MAG TPA: hypothetical protein [Caudoviricetes sp.]
MRYGLNGFSQNVYLLKYTRPRYFHILRLRIHRYIPMHP